MLRLNPSLYLSLREVPRSLQVWRGVEVMLTAADLAAAHQLALWDAAILSPASQA